MGFLAAGGRMRRDRLLGTLERLSANGSFPAVEVMLHPGTGDPYTARKYQHWGYDWQRDLALLQDTRMRAALHDRGMVPGDFRGLMGTNAVSGWIS